MWESLRQDVGFSLRMLIRQPGFTIVALVALALGIGANTAIFSIVDAVLWRSLPYPDANRVMAIAEQRPREGRLYGPVAPADFFDWGRDSRSFAAMAAYMERSLNLTGAGEPERLLGLSVSPAFLTSLGVAPALGRNLRDEEDIDGHDQVVLLTDALWRRRFGADPGVVGRTVMFDGNPYEVAGVLPATFWWPTQPELIVPLALDDHDRTLRGAHFLDVVGRLAPGVSMSQAREELNVIGGRLSQEYPAENRYHGPSVRSLREALVGDVSDLLWILMASVGCVLLIACANLANLLLARATGRSREIAVRQAIGAARGRLVRQLLVESLMLALLGGVAGVLVGKLFLNALVAWLPAGIPRIEQASVDLQVLTFTLVTTALTGLFFGLAPALQLSGNPPAMVLRNDVRTSTGRAPLRALLVIAELAVAVVLLTGAGLLIRSFVLVQRVDPGFKTDRVLTFQTRMEGPAYQKAAARIAFVNGIVDRLKTLPGVTEAAASSYAPIVGRGTGAWFNIIARPWPPGTTPPGVPYRVITADYFKAMQIPLLRGRLLTDRDGLNGTPSVVISESLARRFWPNEDPVGADIYLGAPDNKLFDRAAVVGVVKDVQLSGLGGSLTDAVYGLNTLMPWWRNFTFTVRTSGEPLSLAASARQIVRDADPSIATTGMQAMTDIMRTSIAPTRASMLLLALFAGVALVMAAVGVFGVMSYAVNLRTREMGIRLALGARPAEVRRMVVADGMKQAIVGVIVGAAGAAWVTRTMSSMLFGVSPGDPATLALASSVLLVTAALACYMPARRATRVDPLVVLRAE